MQLDQHQSWPESEPFPCGSLSMFLESLHRHSCHYKGKLIIHKESEPENNDANIMSYDYVQEIDHAEMSPFSCSISKAYA